MKIEPNLILLCIATVALALSAAAGAASQSEPPRGKMIGMYIHQHWPYNHPYCARTWTLDDWRGYTGALKQLGFNTILIWPMLETMPDPMTPSDRASLEKIRRVIDMLHHEMGMRAYVVLCPNIYANKTTARRATFETRHYFDVEEFVDPADTAAVDRMIAWRKKLMQKLKNVDGVAIIDSDPGGYPGSVTADFIRLLEAHRKMFDSVRPGIELIYWMHMGWQGWSRLYQKAVFEYGTPEEYDDTVTRLIALNPEPWGMANGYEYAEKHGIADRVIIFNYGRIEGEPSFPMTNFGGDRAREGGSLPGPRGVMGNAQTHCCQLPNTFAFVRGALGLPVRDEDYVQFANDLIPGQGTTIVHAWQALSGGNAGAMDRSADALAALADADLTSGPLKGMLFGSPRRFVDDLTKMLRLRAAGERFADAAERNEDLKPTLRAYVEAYTTWQATHGFQGASDLGRPAAALRKLHHPAIEECFARFRYDIDPRPGRPNTDFERVRAGFAHMESFASRIGKAMRQALDDMP